MHSHVHMCTHQQSRMQATRVDQEADAITHAGAHKFLLAHVMQQDMVHVGSVTPIG